MRDGGGPLFRLPGLAALPAYSLRLVGPPEIVAESGLNRLGPEVPHPYP